MTEEYICDRLLPRHLDRKEYPRTLITYYQYEVERLGLDKEDTPNKEKMRKRTIRNISFLYQYSMYLTHISNGSPKKIAIFLEKDIRTREFLSSSKEYYLEEKDCKFLSLLRSKGHTANRFHVLHRQPDGTGNDQ